MPLSEENRNYRAHMKNLLAARTNGEGKPLPGYGANVRLLLHELAKLDKLENGDDTPEPAFQALHSSDDVAGG